MHPFLNTIFPAVRKASNLMLNALRDVKALKVSEKDRYDYVTDVDHQSEKILKEAILATYPDHAILAEESGQIGSNDYTWIIDPLDGTRNFVHGFPHFCVSIAIEYKKRLEHGLIYDPIRNELFTATRGKGARLNDYRLRIPEHKTLEGALLATTIPSPSKPYFTDYMAGFRHILPKVSGLRQNGSAALNLAYTAAGRLDAHWEVGLKPWDIAAGALIVKEAGGIVTDTQGGDDYLNKGNVVAGGPKILKNLLQLLHHSS